MPIVIHPLGARAPACGHAAKLIGRCDEIRPLLERVLAVAHGDADAGKIQHGGVIAAVADGHDLFGRDAERAAQGREGKALVGGRVHDLQIDEARAGHEIRQLRKIGPGLLADLRPGKRDVEFLDRLVPPGHERVQIIHEFV